MSTSRQYCTFYLNALLFGIESQRIQEVMRSLDLADVPLAPPSVSGLMNLRGQIVVAIDLRSRLQLPPRAADVLPMWVVVRTPDGSVSLLVDDIGDVVDSDTDSFEPPPETMSPEMRFVIVGVHKLDRQLMHVLNPDSVCEVNAVPEAKAQASTAGR
jgi:purine-binding chemotaxis protein CheW